MMWMSKRFVQPGRNPSIAAAFGKAQSRLWGERRGIMGHALYARSLYRNRWATCSTTPAFLSAFEYTAPDDEDLLWSLRFFNARLMRCGRQYSNLK